MKESPLEVQTIPMKRMFPLFGKYGYAIQEGLTVFINGVFDTKAKSNAG